MKTAKKIYKSKCYYSFVYYCIIFIKKICPFSDERLNGVDDFYSSKRDEHFRTSAVAVEDRLMSFQRQLEERYRTDLKMEVNYSESYSDSQILMVIFFRFLMNYPACIYQTDST